MADGIRKGLSHLGHYFPYFFYLVTLFGKSVGACLFLFSFFFSGHVGGHMFDYANPG